MVGAVGEKAGAGKRSISIQNGLKKVGWGVARKGCPEEIVFELNFEGIEA